MTPMDSAEGRVAIRKMTTWIPMTEATLADLGYTMPGYWERELNRRIARRRIRTRLRIWFNRTTWVVASIPRRLAHARDALMGRDCREDE